MWSLFSLALVIWADMIYRNCPSSSRYKPIYHLTWMDLEYVGNTSEFVLSDAKTFSNIAKVWRHIHWWSEVNYNQSFRFGQHIFDCSRHQNFGKYCLGYIGTGILLSSIGNCAFHYSDVIMSVMVSQITGVSIVCPTVCSDTDRRKHQTLRRWPFWGESTGGRRIPLTKGQ